MMDVIDLRGNLKNLEEKQGYVKWWAKREEFNLILNKLNVDFDNIKEALDEKEGLYCIYIGRSTNRPIAEYLNMQLFGNHNEKLFTTGVSAFRKTIASIVCSNWACGERTDKFLDKLKVEISYVDYPVKSQEAKDELQRILVSYFENHLYVLNRQNNNHPLAKNIKSNLKNLREESKRNAEEYFSLNDEISHVNKSVIIIDKKSEDNNMWFVTAGRESAKFDVFKERDFVAIGWELGDLSGKNKEEIEEKYIEVYGKTKSKGFEVSQINKFVNEIDIGDYIITSKRLTRSYLIGICTSDYFLSDKLDDNDDVDGYYRNCRHVKWIGEIGWEELSTEAKNIIKPKSVYKIKDTVKEEFLAYLSFSSEEKRNIIYFGAPGTGKSYNLNQDKDKLLKNYEDNYERVTFHQDYSYANFVGTYKPVPENKSITYKYVPGPFMRILKKAIENPNEPYLLIIEEINRANVAAVFGDVFQLLDRDENNESEYDIETSQDMRRYLNKEKIKLPSNLFIWATMNSADQGVFPMDTAFKRRWNFKYFSINSGEDLIKDTKTILNNVEIRWNTLRKAINTELLSYKINEDKLMGPFFAFNEYMNESIDENVFKDIFKNKIIMYLFEDAARSRRNELFSGVGKTNVTYSQICEVFDEKGIEIFTDSIKEMFIKDEDD